MYRTTLTDLEDNINETFTLTNESNRVIYNPSLIYGFNGTTWDRVTTTDNALNINVTNADYAKDATLTTINNNLLLTNMRLFDIQHNINLIREYRKNNACYVVNVNSTGHTDTNKTLYYVYNSPTATEKIYVYYIDLEASAGSGAGIAGGSVVNCYVQAFASISFDPNPVEFTGPALKLNLNNLTQDPDFKIVETTNYTGRAARGYIIFTDLTNKGPTDREMDFTKEFIKLEPGEGFTIGYSNNTGNNQIGLNFRMKYIRTSDDI